MQCFSVQCKGKGKEGRKKKERRCHREREEARKVDEGKSAASEAYRLRREGERKGMRRVDWRSCPLHYTVGRMENWTAQNCTVYSRLPSGSGHTLHTAAHTQLFKRKNMSILLTQATSHKKVAAGCGGWLCPVPVASWKEGASPSTCTLSFSFFFSSSFSSSSSSPFYSSSSSSQLARNLS